MNCFVKHKTKEMPTVSIIVPIYNANNILRKTLNSIKNQTYTEFECLLIDDGSDDSVTQEICRHFENTDRRFRYFQKNNEGIEKTRLFGVSRALSNLVMFCDHDDYYESEAIDVLYKAYQTSGADIVTANCYVQRFYRSNIGRKPSVPFVKSEVVVSHREFMADYFINFFGINKFPVSTWGKLYRKSLFQVEIISFNVNFIEDIIINIQIFEKARKVHFVQNYIYTHIYGGLGSSFDFIQGIGGYAKIYDFRKRKLVHYKLSYLPLLIEFKNTLLQYIDKLVDEQVDRTTFKKYMQFTRDQSIFRELMKDEKLKDVHYLNMIHRRQFDEVFAHASSRNSVKRQVKYFVKQIVKKF